MACFEHARASSKNQTLCVKCDAKREERRAARKKRDRGREKDRREGAVAGGGGVLDEEEAQEESIEERVLVHSVRRAPAPWKISVAAAAVGLLLVIAVLLMPAMHRFMPSPYLLLLVPVIAAAWGAAGLMTESEDGPNKSRSMAGLGVAVVAIVLGVVAVQNDPARVEARQAQEQQAQFEQMTDEEREQWRQERLQRFGPASSD